MNRVLMTLWIFLCLAVVAVGYVRLAPSNPEKWHVPLTFETDADFKKGARRVIDGDQTEFDRLDQIIRNGPRTKLLAGSIDDGRLTYVVRTKVFGFPDYTTIERVDGQIRILSRLRFGSSDGGLNRARVERWLKILQTR